MGDQAPVSGTPPPLPSDNLWVGLPPRRTSRFWLWLSTGLVVVIVAVGFGVWLLTQRTAPTTQPHPSQTPLASALATPSPSSTAIPSPAPTTQTPVAFVTTPIPTAAACNLPTVTDTNLGFQVGRPQGWSMITRNGTVLVEKDATGTSAGILYPVYLKATADPDQFVAAYSVTLTEAFAAAGGKLTVDGDKLTGSIGKVPITGELHHQAIGRKVIITGGWAPTNDWASQRDTLLSIGGCYQGTAGILLKIQTQTGTDDSGSTAFQFHLPNDWQVTNLTSHGLELGSSDNTTQLRFAYQTNGLGDQTLDGAADTALQTAQDSTVQFVGEEMLPKVTDAQGTSWQMKTKAYTATLHDQAVYGVVTIALAASDYGYGYGTYSVISAVRQTKTNDWELTSSLLSYLQETLLITDAKPGKNVVLPAHTPAQSSLIDTLYGTNLTELTAGQADNLILGFATVRSPSTRDTYLAPRTTYQDNGSAGPGYYRSLPDKKDEKLEIITP